jgi:hypothetical protein
MAIRDNSPNGKKNQRKSGVRRFGNLDLPQLLGCANLLRVVAITQPLPQKLRVAAGASLYSGNHASVSDRSIQFESNPGIIACGFALYIPHSAVTRPFGRR